MTQATCPAHAPADHPKVARGKTGILLANLGTPDDYTYWPMRRYLSEFLSDKRVIDYPAWKWQPLLQLIILSKRPFSSGKAYESIWDKERGESPLMVITKEQTAKIAETLTARHGEDVMVDFCMRYGNPSTTSKVREMVAAGCERILFFPLYPQYAGATTATANDQFFRALMEEKWQPAARTVEAYFEHPAYIEALAQSVEKAYAAQEKRRTCWWFLTTACQTLPAGGRSLSLPMPENHAPAQRASGLGRHRSAHHVPVAIRPRRLAAPLHRGRSGRVSQKRKARRASP